MAEWIDQFKTSIARRCDESRTDMWKRRCLAEAARADELETRVSELEKYIDELESQIIELNKAPMNYYRPELCEEYY